MWLVLSTSEVCCGGGLEFGHGARIRLCDMAFHVAVEQFDGVQLGCVAGQQVHLNAVNVFRALRFVSPLNARERA